MSTRHLQQVSIQILQIEDNTLAAPVSANYKFSAQGTSYARSCRGSQVKVHEEDNGGYLQLIGPRTTFV